LDRAIASVLAQTYTNWEYIIVSDGSTDNTEAIVKDLDHSEIRFFQIERKTQHHNYDTKKAWQIEGSNAANFALSKVKGKYIVRLDDDDVWEPDFLETMLSLIQLYRVEFMSSNFDYIKDSKVVIDNGMFINPYLKTNKSKYNGIRLGAHSTWFYKSYLKFIKYDPKCYLKKWNSVADTDVLERFVKAGVKMDYCYNVLMHITPRPNEVNIGFKAIQDNILKKV
jgi:glycosyltransferase involved in cell wall biosynthesis